MSIDWRYITRASGLLLPLLFIPLATADVLASVRAEWLGTDAHLYYRASAAWLAGGNPWDAVSINQGREYHYVALPTTTILLAPLTFMPEQVFVPFWVTLQLAAAVFVVRQLKLPWFWIAFPPLVSGVLAGNPSPLLLALLVAAHPIANAVAPLLKVYAGIPLLGERRWRAIAVALSIGLVSIAAFPSLWWQFLSDSGARTGRLLEESTGGFGARGEPLLLAGVAVAIVLVARRDLRAAGWLLPIALWPGSQFHWSTLAMPVMTLPMAYLLALPAHGLPPLAVMVYAVVGEFRHLRARRALAPPTGVQPSG